MAATYYVSQQRGSAGNNGTSQATPKATIAQITALTLAGNDIIYIGPGTYAETITPGQSGTAGNPITWQADPECRYLTSDTPGRVRVTRLAANKPTANRVVDLLTAVRSYHTFNDFIFDGSTSAATPIIIFACAGSTGNILNRCVLFGGYYCISGPATANDCLMSSAYFCTNGATCNRCVGYGANTAFYSSTCNACVGYGQRGFDACTAKNCIAIACYQSGFHGASLSYNCMAFNCLYGWYGTSASTCSNNIAVLCGTGYQGTASGNKLVITSGYYYNCTASVGTFTTNTPTESTQICFDYAWFEAHKLMRFFDPMGFLNLGNATYATTDFWGRVLPQGNGTVDIGHSESPNETISFTAGDYHTTAPAIIIPTKGQYFMQVAVDAGKTLTVGCDCKYTGTATTKPTLSIQGKDITTQTDTLVGSASTWDTLSVSATPSVDCLIDIILSSTNADTTNAYFSDFTVTIA